MNSAYEAGLFLPFCASLRAFLESAVDTFHGLNGVALSLAENRTIIKRALGGQCEGVYISSELENILIHFAYAHKPPKGAEVPATYVAKTMADYLKLIKSAPYGDITQLYAELCQFTHPAAHSVHYMLEAPDDDTLLFRGNIDKQLIEGYAKDRQSYFPVLFMLAFNTPMLVLKVLLHFNLPSYHLRFLKSVDLGGVPAWQKVENILNHPA